MRRSAARRSLAVLVTGVLAVSVAACGGGAQPGGPDSGSVGGEATAWALTGGSESVFRSSFERWNEANPDAQFTAEWFANDAYKEKIRTAVGSGNAPTLIFSWAGGTLADYVANDAVVDLSEEASPLLDRIIPSVAANGSVMDPSGSEGWYAIPNNQSQPVMFYFNQELFDRAGVSVPTTYDELLDAVEKLSAQGVTPIALAGQSKWPELMYIQYLTDRIGGPEVFQRILNGEPGAWSDPAVLEALTKIQELVDAGAFGDSFGSVAADAGADTALVHTGKAAMVLQGSWVYPDFLNNAPEFVEAGKLGFAAFPAVDGGQGDPANVVGNPANFWSVSASASPEAQETAIDYLVEETYSDEAVDEFLSVGAVPPLLGLEDKIADAENPEYLNFVYSTVKSALHFQLSWDQALPADQAQALLDNLSGVFLQQISPEQFVDAMNATLG